MVSQKKFDLEGEFRSIRIPDTYMNWGPSSIRITNHPETASGVTPIQIVTLNRPEKYNAFTQDMFQGLITYFLTVDLDDRVKAIIVTGAGQVFSAGIDLSLDTSAGKDIPTREMRDPGGTLALALFNCSKPVIVAYNGLAVGVALTSMLAAAIRIAPAQSEFGFPFARIGITMESSSSFFLPRMVGYSNATYLLATGKRFPANSPLLQGLFAEVLPEPKDVLPRAIEIARDIVENVSTMALALNRQLIWRNASSPEAAHLVDSPLLFDMFAGKDHLAFKKAFFEKKQPVFRDVLSKNAPRTYPWWTEVSVERRLRAANKPESKI